jgi:HSP20 family protein
MRTRIHAVSLPSETEDFTEEIRRIFPEVGHTDSLIGECSPPLDVYETDETIEITVDLPGVAADAVRIVAKGEAVLIAGQKAPRRGRGDASFHLVERGYGRFARSVRLRTACDVAKARATLESGELRITLPKIADRRAHAIPITVVKPA